MRDIDSVVGGPNSTWKVLYSRCSFPYFAVPTGPSQKKTTTHKPMCWATFERRAKQDENEPPPARIWCLKDQISFQDWSNNIYKVKLKNKSIFGNMNRLLHALNRFLGSDCPIVACAPMWLLSDAPWIQISSHMELSNGKCRLAERILKFVYMLRSYCFLFFVLESQTSPAPSKNRPSIASKANYNTVLIALKLNYLVCVL